MFLDELATLSSPAQTLLRAVEYGEVTRIGAVEDRSGSYVRIVAATNEHFARLVDQGRFRADLLDRCRSKS